MRLLWILPLAASAWTNISLDVVAGIHQTDEMAFVQVSKQSSRDVPSLTHQLLDSNSIAHACTANCRSNDYGDSSDEVVLVQVGKPLIQVGAHASKDEYWHLQFDLQFAPYGNGTKYSGFPHLHTHWIVYAIERASREIEFELQPLANASACPWKSKIALALIEGFSLPAFFGCDRCYLGQPCLGVFKAVTLGGLGFWFLADYIIILIDMLSMDESIHRAGFCAQFGPDQVLPSFVLSSVFLGLACVLGVFHSKYLKPALEN